MNRLLNVQIKDVAPHIFRRPFLLVEPDTRMLQIATFLAIGPQIYVDGLVVMDDKGQTKPVGRIGSKGIIRNILDVGYPSWLQTNASQIMDSFVWALEMNSPLSIALEVYKKTRFAFVPIIAKKDGKEEDSIVAASLAIRDILPLIVKAKLSIPVEEVSSRLISLDGKTSIRDVLDFMMTPCLMNHNHCRMRTRRITRPRKVCSHICSVRAFECYGFVRAFQLPSHHLLSHCLKNMFILPKVCGLKRLWSN